MHNVINQRLGKASITGQASLVVVNSTGHEVEMIVWIWLVSVVAGTPLDPLDPCQIINQCDLYIHTDHRVWDHFHSLENEQEATHRAIESFIRQHVQEANTILSSLKFGNHPHRPLRFTIRTLQVDDDLSCVQSAKNPTCSETGTGNYHARFSTENWSHYCAAIIVTNMKDRLAVEAEIYAAQLANSWGLCAPYSIADGKSYNTALLNLRHHERREGIRETNRTVETLIRILSALMGYQDEETCRIPQDDSDRRPFSIFNHDEGPWKLTSCALSNIGKILESMNGENGHRSDCFTKVHQREDFDCSIKFDLRQWMLEHYWVVMSGSIIIVVLASCAVCRKRLLTFFLLFVKFIKPRVLNGRLYCCYLNQGLQAP